MLAHPQVRARNMVVGVEDPALAAAFPVAGNPIKSPAFADPATRRPAPALDGDRDAHPGLARRRGDAMNTTRLELERDGAILRVWLNRPERRNALDTAALDEIAATRPVARRCARRRAPPIASAATPHRSCERG